MRMILFQLLPPAIIRRFSGSFRVGCRAVRSLSKQRNAFQESLAFTEEHRFQNWKLLWGQSPKSLFTLPSGEREEGVGGETPL